jgi:site-specific DNA recombinase
VDSAECEWVVLNVPVPARDGILCIRACHNSSRAFQLRDGSDGMTRAAIYSRISRDFTGERAGVARQEEDCRAKASALGWEVVRVFVDNDVSAYSGKRRPGYQTMLQAIEAGEVDAVVVWHTDRLYRRIAELEQYITVCEKTNVTTQTVQAGLLDLATPAGRLVARQLGAVAVYESEQKGRRQKAANKQRAAQGKYFGTRRPFGYESDGVTVRDVEAEAIRGAYDLILIGGSLREVGRRWNAAGLHTPQKHQPWNGTIVSRTLRTARLAGIKTYLGDVVRNERGEPIRAEWPAIVDLDTWHAAQAVLNDPGRKLKFGSLHVSQLLLSGIAICDVCEGTIGSGGKLKGRDRYRCKVAMGGHVMREAAPIDEFIESVILRRLAEPDLAEAFQAGLPAVDVAGLRREADELYARMDAIAEAFADGAVTLGQLKASNERATARLAEIEARMPRNTDSAALSTLITARDVEETWSALSLDAKRGVVEALMTVRLLPPKTRRIRPYLTVDGVRRVNPDTIVIEWKS